MQLSTINCCHLKLAVHFLFAKTLLQFSQFVLLEIETDIINGYIRVDEIRPVNKEYGGEELWTRSF